LDREPSWSRNFVVCLPHSLRPEMTRGGWSSQYVDVGTDNLESARCLNCSNELEIFEHRAAVVSVRASQCRSSYAQRAGPVSTGYPVEKRAAGIPDRMKWQRVEVVLWSHDVNGQKLLSDRVESGRFVANIVVGDDHSFVGSESNSGKNSAHFSHWRRELRIGSDVPNPIAERAAMSFEYFRRRTVDDNQLDARHGAELLHIARQIRCWR